MLLNYHQVPHQANQREEDPRNMLDYSLINTLPSNLHSLDGIYRFTNFRSPHGNTVENIKGLRTNGLFVEQNEFLSS